MAEAATWSELIQAAKVAGKSIYIDLKGTSNLGEWYLTMAANRLGLAAAEKDALARSAPDPDVVSDLAQILATCPKGFCRNQSLHDRTGYYARAFVRKEAAAFVGYSEAMHFGFEEALQDCLPEKCLTKDDIGVRRLPNSGAPDSGKSLGWVDALSVRAGLDDRKKELALDFVRMLVEPSSYKLVLEPESKFEAPRYLLPARTDVEVKDAEFYAPINSAFGERMTGTSPGLNGKLRELAKKVDELLPQN